MSFKQDAPKLFTGRIIQQICLGLYDLQLRFDEEGLIIQTGNEVEHIREDGSTYRWEGEHGGRQHFSLNSILEVAVENAEVDDKDTLHLYFSNGERLKITCSHGDFESYTVWVKGSFHVIA